MQRTKLLRAYSITSLARPSNDAATVRGLGFEKDIHSEPAQHVIEKHSWRSNVLQSIASTPLDLKMLRI